ncbi:hypothetical protein AC578_9808 [Pseudocercospora eumusae]|uniref:Guanine nucleotide-exchange factor SEC12 n=1 Tax=Pseudocercospora eumusae TaxID=321146 RepID=A0A139H9L3_9PEZI|nr:hypothetical protein AC578_9808 [Pseudocercospora eumusae]
MPNVSNSHVSYAKHKLEYPIFAADWDPYNRGYLVVAGGGGESKTGVPNKISVLDVNNRATIEVASEIDLPRTEDSPQSLASLATKDGLITFAGINSSQAEQDANKNEHFRSFAIRYPPRKKQKTHDAASDDKGDIKPLGKRSLFKPSSAPKKESYQRLLRLSPVQKRDVPAKRIGAIASGLAQENEIIVFNATVQTPEDKDIITRIPLAGKDEAADLDIAQPDQNLFSLVWCDDDSIHEQSYKYDFAQRKVEKQPNGPRRVYQMPASDSFEKVKSRPKFRSVRFLNAENVIALVNKPGKSGVELRVYHLYPTGPALEMSTKTLPSRVKQASAIDVCALDADSNGNQQFAVAVAGQDISIEIFTINYRAATDTFSSMRLFMTLKDVHETQMTKLTWTPFHSPARAVDPSTLPTTGPNGEPLPQQRPAHPGPQYIRLASVSFGNTVVIDTFPLTPFEPKNKNSRYVLSHPKDEAFWKWAYIFVISFCVLVTAFLFQSFASSGFSDDKNVGVFGFLPQNVRSFLDQPAMAAYGGLSKVTEEAVESPTPVANLRDVVAEHHGSPEDAAATAVVVRDLPEGEGVTVAVHPDKEEYLSKDTEAKHWDELEPHQKSYWKEKLVKAGHWAESEGESVLKSVLWSTYAGLVGQAGEILRNEL